MQMLAKEIPVEEIKISLWKQLQFPCRQQTGFFSANQQGMRHLGKGQDLPRHMAKILLKRMLEPKGYIDNIIITLKKKIQEYN